ncbi:MAG: protein-glutamate O-methyltransferase CheR [Desulfobacteraceae bacterium]|nr:protein-glutamate O-methyltransferase CheR [Desulfobacteraceae bacterium]
MNSIVLSKKQFNDLKTMIYKASGINLHEGKLELLKSKIAKRMRITKKSFDQYLSFLYKNEQEVIEFIDTVTTNHSFFFRENKSIKYIIDQFNNHPQKQSKEFKIWCAACSTGDEPYTVAVQLKTLGLSFSIQATDLSHSVLATATRGIYRNDKLRNVPLPLLHRFFQRGNGKFTGFVKVKKEVMQHVYFQEFNLITDTPIKEQYDAVLCRNVMIYFDPPTSEKVTNKLYDSVVTGGYFAIGNAESLMNLNHKFKSAPAVPSLYIK